MAESIGGLNLVLLGRTGAGKSVSGNTILGWQAFQSKKSLKSVTRDIAVETGTVDGFPVTVYDTPGLFNTTINEEEIKQILEKVIQECDSRPCVFLLVIKADRFTEEESKTLEKIEKLLGENRLKKTWILFTRGDELEEENMTINELINETESLKKFIQKYDQRYHVFNNKTKQPSEQVQGLLTKVIAYKNTYIGKMVNAESIVRRRIPANELNTPAVSLSSIRIVLLGRSGIGKSAAGNTILGREAFISKKSSRSVTQALAVESGTVDGFPVTVYDTPGLFNTTLSEEETQQILEKVLQECESRPCVFLLVIKANRFTEKEGKTVEKIEELLGENRMKKTWILFTGGDQLEHENMTIKVFIGLSETLKKLVQKYDQRYHVFNNKTKELTGQAGLLLAEIIQRSLWLKDTPAASVASRRIVLLGKSGVGKSAAGNTILGQNVFRSMKSAKSVTSESSVKHATVSGRCVSVVDTAGFIDTHMNLEESASEIMKCMDISSPGPHAFLIVFPVNMRFTEHEQQIPQMIEMMFGQEVLKYSIILFTHGDQKLGNLQRSLRENSVLKLIVDQCGGRFHIFNNKDLSKREQVNDLLKKIDIMIEQNGGGHYSNQIYKDVYRFRQEEEKQREEEKRKQQEEKQRHEMMERVRRQTEERIRAAIEGHLRSELERLEAENQRVEKQKDTCVCS